MIEVDALHLEIRVTPLKDITETHIIISTCTCTNLYIINRIHLERSTVG